MRVIAFKVWSDFAHFRKHYTTSSPLTHSIPPPSALRGLVGAMLGFSRREYYEILRLEKASFGVRIISPIKKVRIPLNYIDTKDGAWVTRPPKGRLHTQVRVEFLKDPVYEIFIHHQHNDLMDILSEMLRNHKTIFTPYLGITECIANFEFLWDVDVYPISGMLEVLSAFRIRDLKEFKLEDGVGIVKERVPVFIDSNRIRQKAEEVVFNPRGKPIIARLERACTYPNGKGQSFTFLN